MSYEGFIKSYEDATNSHDFNNVAKLITEDAVYWFSTSSYRGKEEVQTYFENTWSLLPDEKYKIFDIQWISVSDTNAVCLYRYHWQGTYKGELKEGSGRGTNVLVKESGVWKLLHEHLSSDK